MEAVTNSYRCANIKLETFSKRVLVEWCVSQGHESVRGNHYSNDTCRSRMYVVDNMGIEWVYISIFTSPSPINLRDL